MINSLFCIIAFAVAISFYFPSTSPKKVVVIGAGLSGLTTAYRLKQHGFDVEVYEARQRVGGRVFSAELDGHIIELGGQNIYDGGEATHIIALINELGLTTLEKTTPSQFCYFENHKSTDIKKLIKERNFRPKALKEQLLNISQTASNMEEVLQALFSQDDLLNKACKATLSAYEGAIPEKLSPLYIETLFHILSGGLSAAHPKKDENNNQPSFEHLIIKGGNSKLPEKLAQELSRSVYLEHELTHISKNTSSGSYILKFKNGNIVQADILILTLPCPVYKHLSIDTDVLPKERKSSIENLQYGTSSKLIVPIQIPNIKGFACSDERAVTFPSFDENTLNVYFTGSWASFDEKTINQRYEEELELINHNYKLISSQMPILARDEMFAKYTSPVAHCWVLDPYALGSYSSIGIDQEYLFTDTINIAEESVNEVFAPIDNTLFFAGEHTTILTKVGGTMEAAVESGERTARLVVKLQK